MVGHMRRIGALYTLIDIHNYDRPLVMIKETSGMCPNTLFEYTEVLFLQSPELEYQRDLY